MPANSQLNLVYLASTAPDLDLERHEMVRYMARNGLMNIGLAYNEEAGIYDWDLVREQIERADGFVLLLGDEYGPMSPTGISHLHREFVHAMTLRKPMLAFVKNSLQSASLTEDQRRLQSFHRVITSSANYKLWHLRDELISLAKASLPGFKRQLETGWQSVSLRQHNAQVANEAPTKTPYDPQKRAKLAMQTVNLRIAAKVYQGGNLSRESVLFPARLDQLFKMLEGDFKQGVSEEKLRTSLETLIAPAVSRQLLKRHSHAHAVDDIKVSKTQFHQVLGVWKSLGFVDQRNLDGRPVWHL